MRSPQLLVQSGVSAASAIGKASIGVVRSWAGGAWAGGSAGASVAGSSVGASEGSSLAGASLAGASLAGASLTGASLAGASLVVSSLDVASCVSLVVAASDAGSVVCSANAVIGSPIASSAPTESEAMSAVARRFLVSTRCRRDRRGRVSSWEVLPNQLFMIAFLCSGVRTQNETVAQSGRVNQRKWGT
ncbi:pentapeptide repeat-containing protein [Agromyces sp. CCNWLW203]|uniref:pentapeptide repeat-containing protein n=1 Tax=Agromyces sp. CCNWLW203 TaxID=3112842 RepID=UPI003FA54809